MGILMLAIDVLTYNLVLAKPNTAYCLYILQLQMT